MNLKGSCMYVHRRRQFLFTCGLAGQCNTHGKCLSIYSKFTVPWVFRIQGNSIIFHYFSSLQILQTFPHELFLRLYSHLPAAAFSPAIMPMPMFPSLKSFELHPRNTVSEGYPAENQTALLSSSAPPIHQPLSQLLPHKISTLFLLR